jgi:hypothetical protein
MAGFHTKTFLKYDDYMTPKSAWENIQDYIPKDKVIWEPFYGDGKSGEYLRELNFEVIHQKEDFFENNRGDVIVSNPPFSDKRMILERLKTIDKPFIVLFPQPTINTSFIRDLYGDDIQIIVPRKRIQFIKNGNEIQNKCNFDCFYYCYKMNLEKDIIFLSE